jgi:hypothetical protein
MITPKTFTIGDTVTVLTRVRNQGQRDAPGTVVREIPQYRGARANQATHLLTLSVLPAQPRTAWIAGTGPRQANGVSCRRQTPARCALGTLAPGQQFTIRSTVRVQAPGELHSIEFVSADAPDSNLTNNASIQDLTSSRTPEAFRVRVSGPSRGLVGSRYTYTVSVTGIDPAAARGVRLCTRAPVTFIGRNAPGTFRWQGRLCHDYSTLRRGQTRSFAVQATPAASGPVTLNATATAVGTPRAARDTAPALIIGATCRAGARRALC